MKLQIGNRVPEVKTVRQDECVCMTSGTFVFLNERNMKKKRFPQSYKMYP